MQLELLVHDDGIVPCLKVLLSEASSGGGCVLLLWAQPILAGCYASRIAAYQPRYTKYPSDKRQSSDLALFAISSPSPLSRHL